MRTTLWLLPVCLVLAVIGGCSSTRWGLAKSETPAKKPKDADVVEYGNPWKKKKEEPVEPKELPPELAKLKQKRLEAKDQPPDVTPWLKNAAVAESKGELGAAKELYKKILDKEPSNAEAHHRLAVIADQQQDPQTADVHYQTVLKLNRKDADLLSDMGYSLFLRGKLDESEMRLKEALEANPYHRGAQSNLGLVYGKQGKYDQALAAFRQAGTESEAQRNMARLFPNGRPNGSGASGATENLAQNPRRAPDLPLDADPQLAGTSFADVKARMQQERDAAARARQEQTQREFRPDVNFADNATPPANRNNAQPSGFANNVNPAPNANANPAWPPVTASPPATFNPNFMNNINNGAMASSPAATTNVAKPAEENPFWTGNYNAAAANATSLPPTSNMNPAFATNMSPPASMGNNFAAQPQYPASMNADSSTAWMGNDTGLNGGFGGGPAAGNREIQQAGFNDFGPANGVGQQPTTMNEASRIAAQMAMATGPGGLLPVVTPVRGGSAAPANNGSNRVHWAYGETSGTSNRDVENAVWTRQQGSDRSAPVTPANATSSEFGSFAPAQPWGNWESPAPAAINWGQDVNTPAAANPPAWNPNNNAPSNAPANTLPAWPGNNTESAMNGTNNPTADNYRWGDFTTNGQTNVNNRPVEASSNNNMNGGSTTISNWPHAPSRP